VLPLTDLWRMLLGLLIIAVVLLSPTGIVGGLMRWLPAARHGDAA
jgi:ABC-type branched-subunit amino acid transport system permease subunit